MTRLQLLVIEPFHYYQVPRNPTSFEPTDSANVSWKGGLNIGNRYEKHYDNREAVFVWNNVPAYAEFNDMIHEFENFQYYDSIMINLGNGLLPGLYSDAVDWYNCKVTRVNTKIETGKKAVISGGQSFNLYSKIELHFEIYGAINE